MSPKKMQPIPPPANAPPKWKQDEMFRAEEYPSPVGTSIYNPTRTAAQLTPDEVRTIRRLGKLKQDMGALARGFGISSKECGDVAGLRDRAEVPSDFESPGQKTAREIKHRDNVVRKAKEAEGKSK